MYEKHFQDWILLKERLEFRIDTAPFVNEGEVWWASIGENVGFEISGKSERFTRPVLIFRKLSSGFYFVIPLTTKKRDGSWYISFRQKHQEITACLHQARSIDYRRFYSKIGEVAENDFILVKEKFKKLYLL